VEKDTSVSRNFHWSDTVRAFSSIFEQVFNSL
jgi:hypothetical protein